MRVLSSDAQDALFQTSQKGVFCYLFEINVRDGDTLFFTDYPKPLVYNNQLYTPYPIRVDTVEETSRPEIKTFNVVVANIDRQLVAYLESGFLIGQNVTFTYILVKNE